MRKADPQMYEWFDNFLKHLYEKGEKLEQEKLEVLDNIDLSRKKVLLVDDNALNREIAAEILGDEEMIVETACDGLMAVNAVMTFTTICQIQKL